MPELKDIQDTDGVENPRMTGDSADQMFDDDTLDDNTEDLAEGRQRRAGGQGGLGSGGGKDFATGQ